MLKLTYTETGLYLELVPESTAPRYAQERSDFAIEEWLHLRLTLALRTGQLFQAVSGSASFLLPIDLPGMARLHRLISRTEGEILLSPADYSSVEITLRGVWIASTANEAEGVFVSAIDQAIELLLFELWQVSERQISSLKS